MAERSLKYLFVWRFAWPTLPISSGRFPCACAAWALPLPMIFLPADLVLHAAAERTDPREGLPDLSRPFQLPRVLLKSPGTATGRRVTKLLKGE